MLLPLYFESELNTILLMFLKKWKGKNGQAKLKIRKNKNIGERLKRT